MNPPDPTPATPRDRAPSALTDRFHGLPPSLRALAEQGVVRHFRKGQRLIEEGEIGDLLFIITRGRLRAFASGDSGRQITYGTYGPGEYIGEMSLDGGPRSASVEAVEAAECVQITRATLLAHIASHPEFAFELLAKVIRRARVATLSTKQLALNDVYGRLVALLGALAGPPSADGVRTIAERLTHREIASRLGCSREMVSRLLKDLEQGAYVRTDGRTLELLKPLPVRW